MCCRHSRDNRCQNGHEADRRGFLKRLGCAVGGLVGFLVGARASAANAVCGAKCISYPYDGGTCTKSKDTFHQFHYCSKDHSW